MTTISRMGGRYLSDEETESLLKEAKITVFCSKNRDGTIHAMPVWFKYSENEVVILTPSDSRKARNVERDDRVTLLIEDREVMKGVLVNGIALVDRCDPMTTAVEINEKYMSPEKAVSFAEKAVHEWGLDLVLRIKIERTTSFHY